MTNATNAIKTVSSIVSSELALDMIISTAIKRNMRVSVRDTWETGKEICVLAISQDFKEIRAMMSGTPKCELRFYDVPEVGNAAQSLGSISIWFSRHNTGLESVEYYRGEPIEKLVNDVEAKIQKIDELYRSLENN